MVRLENDLASRIDGKRMTVSQRKENNKSLRNMGHIIVGNTNEVR